MSWKAGIVALACAFVPCLAQEGGGSRQDTCAFLPEIAEAFAGFQDRVPGATGVAVCPGSVLVFITGEDDTGLEEIFRGQLIQATGRAGISGAEAFDPGPIEFQRRARIDLLGAGIGEPTGYTSAPAGSLGCLVHDGKDTFALSSAHVFAPVIEAKAGDELLSAKGMTFASLYRWRPLDTYTGLRTGHLNTVDAAIGLLESSDMVKQDFPDDKHAPKAEILGLPKISELLCSGTAIPVTKYGAETGRTYGAVECIAPFLQVDGVWFGSQIVIRGAFAQPGDSGSLVVTNYDGINGHAAEDSRPVGLLFAGWPEKNLYFANPIDEVLCCLGVEIVGGVPPAVGCPCNHPLGMAGAER